MFASVLLVSTVEQCIRELVMFGLDIHPSDLGSDEAERTEDHGSSNVQESDIIDRLLTLLTSSMEGVQQRIELLQALRLSISNRFKQFEDVSYSSVVEKIQHRIVEISSQLEEIIRRQVADASIARGNLAEKFKNHLVPDFGRVCQHRRD